jgi:hypothetical protein
MAERQAKLGLHNTSHRYILAFLSHAHTACLSLPHITASLSPTHHISVSIFLINSASLALSHAAYLLLTLRVRHTLTLILTLTLSLSRAVLFIQQSDACGLVSDAAAHAEECKRAALLEDTLAKGRLLISELSAATAANNELKGALDKTRAEHEETKKMLGEATRYHYRTFLKRYEGHPTRMLDCAEVSINDERL